MLGFELNGGLCRGRPAYLGYEPRVLTVEQTALMALPVRFERTTL